MVLTGSDFWLEITMGIVRRFLGFLGLVLAAAGLSGCSGGGWKGTVADRLGEYGHRNWIVIADAAYPKQSAAGIETIDAGGGQIEAVQYVLEQIEAAGHVKAVVMVDKELAFVSEADAPGVDAYRQELHELIKSRIVRTMPHEEIIRKLDESSALFNVLLIKTDMALPYTSVFIELDCGYWDGDKEQRLREVFKAAVRN